DIDDINLPRSLIKVTGKGNKQRMVPLTVPAVKDLDAWLTRGGKRLLAEKHHTPAIFLGARWNGIGARQMRDVVNRLFSDLVRTSASSVHVLRHVVAAQLLSGGADVRSVRALLGH